MSTANNSTTSQPPNPRRKQAAAATVLGRVFGEEVLAALREGVLKGDLTGVVPLLAAATARPYLRKAAQAAFAAACAAGEADAAALLLECDGIDGNAAVNPGYVRPTHNDGHYGYAVNDEDNAEGDTVLARAARRGRGDLVCALVGTGKVDVNRAGPNGGLPLVLAIRSKDTACVEALLSADGVDANAAVNPNYEGSSLDYTVEDGDTVLVRAARHCDAGAVRALVASGKADVNRAAPNGDLPLTRAILSADEIGVEVLLATDGTSWGQSILQGLLGAARALAAAKGIDLNYRHQHLGRTALHEVCARKHAALAEHLLIAGGCRFALTTAGGDRHFNDTKAGDTALALAAGDTAVTKLFASGVDYWQRRLHGRHGWAMKEAARTLLLVRQRLDAHRIHHALAAPGPAALPHLPEEIWLAALGFLRSADFMP